MKLSILAYVIKKVQQGLGIVQDTDTATQAISSGKYVFWKNKFKKASTNIAENDTLSMSNLVDVNGGALNEITEHIGSLIHIKQVDGTTTGSGALAHGINIANNYIIGVRLLRDPGFALWRGDEYLRVFTQTMEPVLSSTVSVEIAYIARSNMQTDL